MDQRKLGIAAASLTMLSLAGCASQPGYPGAERLAYAPTNIRVIEKESVSAYCVDNRATLGCAVRLRESNQCIVFVKHGLPYALHGQVITGETNRCLGSA